MSITYAIGDIHGRLDLLRLAADAIMRDLDGRSARCAPTDKTGPGRTPNPNPPA